MSADIVFYNGLLLEGKMTDALVRAVLERSSSSPSPNSSTGSTSSRVFGSPMFAPSIRMMRGGGQQVVMVGDPAGRAMSCGADSWTDRQLAGQPRRSAWTTVKASSKCSLGMRYRLQARLASTSEIVEKIEDSLRRMDGHQGIGFVDALVVLSHAVVDADLLWSNTKRIAVFVAGPCWLSPSVASIQRRDGRRRHLRRHLHRHDRSQRHHHRPRPRRHRPRHRHARKTHAVNANITHAPESAPVESALASRPEHSPESPLSIHAMTVAYHRKPVLWDVDYDAPPQELIAIVGPNGAGKHLVESTASDKLTLLAIGLVEFWGGPCCRQPRRLPCWRNPLF